MKKTANLLLMFTMLIVLILSGCSKEDGSTEQGINEKDSTAETVTMFLAESWPSSIVDPSWTDPIAKEITKRTGITVKVTTLKSDNADAELNMMMAADELTDIVVAYDDRKTRLISGGFVRDLDELIEQYGPNIKRNLGPFFDNWREDDGKMYALGNWNWNAPTKYALNLQINTLHMRYDILKELGYDKLDRNGEGNSFITVDEYTRLLDQVKSRYPDLEPALIEGEDAYKTMIMSTGIQSRHNTVFENGKGYYLYNNPYTEKAIAFLNKLYTGGYIPKGFASFKQEENESLISNGKVFSTLGNVPGLSNSQAALSESNDERRMVMFYLIDNPNVKSIFANGYWGIGGPSIMVSKKSEKVEAVMKLFDYLATEEGSLLLNAGVEGVTYNRVDGKNVPTDEVAKGYAAWDTNVIKKYGVGGWFNIFPSLAGVDKEGNANDINAQKVFEDDKWVVYNNMDWKRFSYTQIVSGVGDLKKENNPEAFEAFVRINGYAKDRMVKAIVAPDGQTSKKEWAKAVQQMESDGLAELNKALEENWIKLAKALNKDPEKLNQVEADK
ncbi:extracellular solute-binding protein [Paenibacillus gansuensis]|uniref:Extracellular solute-binding protein n=1 Tax=Paenibacillus gansuensis TaxID=306542 RepID=A0ABW5PAJ8_9BACL